VAFGLATVLVGMVGVWVAVGAHPGHDVALWTAPPLLIAGLGGGLVISPNLTLTLSRVPVERAGSAGGVLQTGQRIGSAAGIAVTGSVFYNQLASSAATTRRRSATASSASPRSSPPRSCSCWPTCSRATLERP
jgi:hypothetical protein